MEFAHGVREEVDAHAERPYPVHRVEHLDLGARLVQAQRAGQPPDAGPDDDTAQTSAGATGTRHRTS